MNLALIISALMAVMVALVAYMAGRIFITATARYQTVFEQSASRNLAEMFLFIEPKKLFALNLAVLALTFLFLMLAGAGLALAVISAVLIGASPPLIYRLLHRRRRMRAVSQLPDALMAIANNLAAGLSLNQALETTIEFEAAPLSQELALVLRELRIGVPFEEALDNLYKRLPAIEVQLVTSAMKVSRQIGGSLSDTLKRIADTLRKRLQMEGKIRSLTAQGKLQGLVMTGLPIFLIVVLSQMQPQAMSYLFHAWYGWATIAVIVVMEAIGYHFIYKIVNIDV